MKSIGSTCCILLSILLFSELAFSVERRRGIIHRTQIVVCSSRCGIYYLEPDPDFNFIYLEGELEGYLELHVEVVGFRVSCGGCSEMVVTDVRILPLTDTEDGLANLPSSISLEQNFPNPFNPTTAIHYTLPDEMFVSITIMTILGESVTKLISERQPAGRYLATWDASGMPSGVYVCRLTALGSGGRYEIQRRTMLLMR